MWESKERSEALHNSKGSGMRFNGNLCFHIYCVFFAPWPLQHIIGIFAWGPLAVLLTASHFVSTRLSFPRSLSLIWKYITVPSAAHTS